MHSFLDFFRFLAVNRHPDRRGSLRFASEGRFYRLHGERGRITLATGWRPGLDSPFTGTSGRTLYLGPQRWPLVVWHIYRGGRRIAMRAAVALALLLVSSASFAASKAPAAPCSPHTIDGHTVSAGMLKSGNLSVCKPPETRITFKVTARAAAPQVHKATAYSCEYWLPLGADSAGPKADGKARAVLLASGFDACVDAMSSAAEKGGAK